jgi:putative spermidine/putrescine transport system permease protein
MKARGATAQLGRAATVLVIGGVYLFLLAPVIVVVAASFDGGDPIAGRAFLKFPPTELSLQWYFAIQPRLFHALWISFLVASAASIGGILVGVPAALGLSRGKMPGKTVISALFRAPLQIPFIVIGVAFLQTYYLISDHLGLPIAGSFVGLALGHLFVAIPYVIGSVGAVLTRFNPSLEEAALSLGASRWSTFRRITLPIIMPGIYAGALFAFMVSFGDVPISLFLASPKYTTLPLEIFHSMEFDFDAAILAISSLIVFASLGLLWMIQKVAGLDVLLRTGGNG